jgi:hypothetical protein
MTRVPQSPTSQRHPAKPHRTPPLSPADPAHLPHSHHRLSPALTRDRAGPMPFTPLDPPAPSDTTAAGATAAGATASSSEEVPDYSFPHAPPVGTYSFPSALSRSGVVCFNAPCSVVYEYTLPSNAHLWTLVGWSWLVGLGWSWLVLVGRVC